MEPLKSEAIYGTWGTLLLPLNVHQGIDYSLLAEETDILISSGIQGIYSNGTAGEFYNQTEDEFDRVSAILSEKCNAAGMPFQIGCTHVNPWQALERVRRAVSLKPSAVQIILPDWFPPAETEILAFLEVMAAEADPVGLVLYNPPHAKKQLSPRDFRRIREAGIPLVGCKLAGGDAQWYADMKDAWPELSLFVPGHHLASGMAMGAHGAYSNVACLNPAAAGKWYEQIKSDPESALELEGRIQRFMNDFIVPYIRQQAYSNQAVDKFMAVVGGWINISSRLRWPYRWIPEEEAARVRKHATDLLPEFFHKDSLS